MLCTHLGSRKAFDLDESSGTTGTAFPGSEVLFCCKRLSTGAAAALEGSEGVWKESSVAETFGGEDDELGDGSSTAASFKLLCCAGTGSILFFREDGKTQPKTPEK